MIRQCICPMCWHEETRRARQAGTEPCRDDSVTMRWSPPHGCGGQIVHRGDDGWWQCGHCDFRATPHEVAMFLDAALTLSCPDCDSVVDGVHHDVVIAERGGRVQP